MCLAVPMMLTEIEGEWGVASLGGTRVTVNLSLLDDVKVGDYVLVHAGFAIQTVDEEEAEKTLKILNIMMDETIAMPDEPGYHEREGR